MGCSSCSKTLPIGAYYCPHCGTRVRADLFTCRCCGAVRPPGPEPVPPPPGPTDLTTGPAGERVMAFNDFHRLPGNTPQTDTNLLPDEIVIAVELPPQGFAENYSYLKIRDRASYAFALVSVAAALDIDSDKEIKAARIALGGVAHKPWRANAVEKKLIGQTADEETFRDAAEAELAPAKGYKYNSFKIELAKRAIVRALSMVAAMS